MKRIAIVLFILFTMSKTDAQGISFEHGTFKEALAKAKSEKKLVFIDCYTTWCGPCKLMARDIFPQENVGKYMNSNFISLKMDMEKGEGIELVKTYNVKAYPTLLFLDAEGKVVHRGTGAQTAEDFIELAKAASDPSKRLSYLEKQYQSGNRDLRFVAQYVKALGSAYNPEAITKVGKEIIPGMKTDQYFTRDGFTILQYAGIEYKSKPYEFFLKNKQKFIEKRDIGKQAYDFVIGNSIGKYLLGIAASAKSMDEVKKAVGETHKDFISPMQDLIDNRVYAMYYLNNKQYNTWFEFNKKEADSSFLKDKEKGLINYVNMAYSVASDPRFENAGLYDRSIAMIENIKNVNAEMIAINYCLASLYYKTGNKEKALENINHFIKISSAKGEAPDKRALDLQAKIENL